MDHRVTNSQAKAAAITSTDFERLFEANFDDIWRFARRRLTTAADADEVSAEVFAVAWRRRHSLPESSERRLWLFGAARNVLANHRRSSTRQDRVSLRLVQLAEAHRHQEPPEPEDPVLWNALACLSEDDRELLIMRAWDELSVADMAGLLDITPNAVSVRLSKARGRLRQAIEQVDHQTNSGETDLDRCGHGAVDPESGRSKR